LHPQNSETKILLTIWPTTSQEQWCGDFEESEPRSNRTETSDEVLKKVAEIEKREAERKAKYNRR
jgi:hypothetical protein